MRLKSIFLLIIFYSYFALNLFAVEQNKADKFCFADVIKIAETEAKKTYQARKVTIPKIIKDMDYNQYGAIRYNPDYDLWYKEGIHYRVNFFHLGMLYNIPAEIYEITQETKVKPIPFNPDFFSCFSEEGKQVNKAMPKDAGYAGFRLTYDSENNHNLPNDAVFLGSSYFRVASGGASYGLSNRAIAINTGIENVAEEFPAFEKYWLTKPEITSKEVVILAYLNGKSVTGAYSFKITLGEKPEIDVKSVIFLRQNVKLLGLTPITSMFWFACGKMHDFHDYRPSVHNSEGLIVSNNNRKIWEPLINYPTHKMINDDIYCESTPEYFGLIQRNRDYNFYMDHGVCYHLNPNCWIIPQNNWGAGKVRLFIFPTQNEWTDNVNAFWVPEKLPEIGKPYEFNYKIVYSLKEPKTELTYVKYNNIGTDINENKHTAFLLSYADKDGIIEKNAKDIKVDLDISEKVAVSLPSTLKKVSYNNTWEVKFNLSAEKLNFADKPYIIKVTLLVKDKPISETWYYQWYP